VSTTPPRATPGRAWIGLAVVLIFDVWFRAHTFAPALRGSFVPRLWGVVGSESEPLDCDEAAYAYIGHRLVAGDVMYRDLTENKPPLGYWLYALTVALGGYRELTIRVMPIPFVLATIALLWWMALRLAGPGAAVLAAGIYAVASTDPYLFGNGANFEHFINLFAIAALALMVRALDRPHGLALGAAGVCVGAASLVKQVAGAALPLFVVALLVARQAGGEPRSLRSRLRDVLILLLGFVLAWGLAISILVVQGAGAAAFDDIVRYGGALATDVPAEPNAPPFLVRWFTGNADPRGTLPWPFGRTKYLVWWGTGTWPLWLAAVPSVLWLLIGPRNRLRQLSVSPGFSSSAPPNLDPPPQEGRDLLVPSPTTREGQGGGARTRRLGASGGFVAAWTLTAWVQVALPRLFWQHYYLLPLPGIALVVAVTLVDAMRRLRSSLVLDAFRASLWAATCLLLAGAIASTGWIQVRDYLHVSPEQLAVRYKGGAQWIADRDLGRELERRAKVWRDPKLFVWGWQSPLFFYSGLDGVTPHFFTDNLLKTFAESDHPLIRPRIERIMRDLKAHPPELIFAGYPPFPALRAFLRERYRPSHLAFGLWVERGRFAAFEADPHASTAPVP
jgi:4-amino-4-deoxy-L-arabinose transferase-like glycosyltransferase